MPTVRQTAHYLMIDFFASSERSVMDKIYGDNRRICKERDHEGFLQQTKKANEYFYERMNAVSNPEPNTREFIKQLIGEDPDPEQKYSNFFSVMDEVVSLQKTVFDDGKPLITGKTFPECIEQYEMLCNYVEGLWERACREYEDCDYPISTFFSILAIEESGKLERLWLELGIWNHERIDETQGGDKVARDHRNKQFLAAVNGATQNTRLMDLIGKDAANKFLEDAQQHRIERLRQDCLYIESRNGEPSLPKDVVNKERAREMLVLSGEIGLQILGFFPWDYDRLLVKIKKVELSIGYSKSVVDPPEQNFAEHDPHGVLGQSNSV